MSSFASLAISCSSFDLISGDIWIVASHSVHGARKSFKRLPSSCGLQLREIAAEKRHKHQHGKDIQQLLEREGQVLLAAIPKNNYVIALNITGQSWSTEQLAEQLSDWLSRGRDISLLVGGPEGLSDQCLKQAHQHWSLSPLTFPHPLVRVIVAEQIYRAHSLIQHHPYHK